MLKEFLHIKSLDVDYDFSAFFVVVLSFFNLWQILKGGTTKLIIGRPLSVRIRPLECAAVRCPSRLFGLSVRSADGQMRTDSGRMRTDADGQRTDGTHTAHGQCSFVTIDSNLSISLDPLLASGRMRTDSGCVRPLSVRRP